MVLLLRLVVVVAAFPSVFCGLAFIAASGSDRFSGGVLSIAMVLIGFTCCLASMGSLVALALGRNRSAAGLALTPYVSVATFAVCVTAVAYLAGGSG